MKTIIFKFAMLMSTTCVVLARNVDGAEPRLALIHQNEEDKSVQLAENFERVLNVADKRPGERYVNLDSLAHDDRDIGATLTRGSSGDSKTRTILPANRFGDPGTHLKNRDPADPRISLLLASRDWFGSQSNIMTILDDRNALLNGDSAGNRRRGC